MAYSCFTMLLVSAVHKMNQLYIYMCMCVCMCVCVPSRFSYVQLFETPWTVAHQAPLSMGFSRQEYWRGLPCPPPGDLPNPGIKPLSPALQADSLPMSHQGSLYIYIYLLFFWISFPFRSPQSTEYSSLCYAVGSH